MLLPPQDTQQNSYALPKDVTIVNHLKLVSEGGGASVQEDLYIHCLHGCFNMRLRSKRHVVTRTSLVILSFK